VNVVKTLYTQVDKENSVTYAIHEKTGVLIENNFHSAFMWLYEKQIDGNYDANFLVNDEEIKKIFFNKNHKQKK
jgi:hypothetical protein